MTEPRAAPTPVGTGDAIAPTSVGTGDAVAPAPSGRPADDLGILDFADYDVIIDARSPREFDDDHLPGAVNLPVVGNEQFVGQD